MRFEDIAAFFDRVESTGGRLEMAAILAELFRTVKPTELQAVINLSSGRLHPEYDSREFGIADKLVLRAISSVSGMEQKKVDELAIKTVDELFLYCPFYHTLSYYIGDDTITGSNFGMQANTQWSPETTNYKD